jgi:hypothetical protein
MSDPISLRKIPPEALKLAQELSAQTGLSINDVFRLALASGLLVEVTKVAPGPDGTLAGWEGLLLAKALRRHLVSAIDLLLEYGQHPYQTTTGRGNEQPIPNVSRETATPKGQFLEHSINDDLDMLDFGGGLSETPEANR